MLFLLVLLCFGLLFVAFYVFLSCITSFVYMYIHRVMYLISFHPYQKAWNNTCADE